MHGPMFTGWMIYREQCFGRQAPGGGLSDRWISPQRPGDGYIVSHAAADIGCVADNWKTMHGPRVTGRLVYLEQCFG
jgi:hypothetical protein